MLQKIIIIVGVLLIITGIFQTTEKIYHSFQYHVVPATITAVTQSEGTCRRRTGKIEGCRHFDITVSYQVSESSKQQTAMLTTESKKQNPEIGSVIQVFVNKNNPQEVSVDILREGWKTPLSFLSLGLFFLLFGVLQKSKTAQASA